MAPVVSEEYEAGLQSRGSNQKVKIANDKQYPSPAVALASEHSAGFAVNAQSPDASQEVVEQACARWRSRP